MVPPGLRNGSYRLVSCVEFNESAQHYRYKNTDLSITIDSDKVSSSTPIDEKWRPYLVVYKMSNKSPTRDSVETSPPKKLMKTDEKTCGAKDNNITGAATSMEVEVIPPPCAPPDQQQQELRSEPEKEDAEKPAEKDTVRSEFTARSLPLSRSRSPLVSPPLSSLLREPSTTIARSKSRSRSRSPKVKSVTQPRRPPSVEHEAIRSASLPAKGSVKKLTPGKLALKENPRSVCDARYSPNVNNVIIFRQHPVRKEFWDRYPPEKHPILKQHSDKKSGLVYCCSKCNDFLPKKDLMMWQDCDRRWPNHSASCHPEVDFFVSPTGRMFMKNPANASSWWALSRGKPHFDEMLQVIKELSKSLPPFCLPDLDGNIFSVAANNFIGCMRCGFSYPKQVRGNCNGWDKQIEEHYKKAHPNIALPSKEDIVSMWNDTIVFQKGRTPTPS